MNYHADIRTLFAGHMKVANDNLFETELADMAGVSELPPVKEILE